MAAKGRRRAAAARRRRAHALQTSRRGKAAGRGAEATDTSRTLVTRVAIVVAVLSTAVAVIAIVTRPSGDGADQAVSAAAGSTDDETHTTDPDFDLSDNPAKEEHSSHTYAWQYMRPEDQATLSGEVERARRAVMRYPTLADAERAGLVVSQFTTDTGAHVVDWREMDDRFDIDHPEMLIYRSLDPDAPVVAASYHVVTGSEGPPQGFTGVNDHWHEHRRLCWDDDRRLLAVESVDDECADRGGHRLDSDGWMLHAWVVDGWANPGGLFSPLNPMLLVASSD